MPSVLRSFHFYHKRLEIMHSLIQFLNIHLVSQSYLVNCYRLSFSSISHAYFPMSILIYPLSYFLLLRQFGLVTIYFLDCLRVPRQADKQQIHSSKIRCHKTVCSKALQLDPGQSSCQKRIPEGEIIYMSVERMLQCFMKEYEFLVQIKIKMRNARSRKV